MPDSLQRNVRRFLVLGIFVLLLTLAFWLGFELGSGEHGLMGQAQFVVSPAQREQLLEECANSRERLVASRQALAEEHRERLQAEQARSIAVGSLSDLREQMGRLEDERSALGRQVSYLKRLVHDGGKGAIEITNFRLLPGESERLFRYAFNASQLIPGFGRSSGVIGLKVRGKRDAQEIAFDLAELPSARPRRLAMGFEYFQEFSGELELPGNFAPESVVIDIRPQSSLLLPNSMVFPWPAAGLRCRPVANPED